LITKKKPKKWWQDVTEAVFWGINFGLSCLMAEEVELKAAETVTVTEVFATSVERRVTGRGSARIPHHNSR